MNEDRRRLSDAGQRLLDSLVRKRLGAATTSPEPAASPAAPAADHSRWLDFHNGARGWAGRTDSKTMNDPSWETAGDESYHSPENGQIAGVDHWAADWWHSMMIDSVPLAPLRVK